MSDREKLIELLMEMSKKLQEQGGVTWYDFADHLISNGVTVQKWIPVSERLPEDDSHVLVARKNGDVDTDMHIYTWWKVGPVEPPKECE